MKSNFSTSLKISTFRYILSVIDTENYNVECDTDLEKVNFVYQCFLDEFWNDWNQNRYSQNKITGFAEYLKGLPSVINVAFNDDEIIALLVSWNCLEKNASYAKQNAFIANWFSAISNKFFQLKKELTNNPTKVANILSK